MIRDFNEAITKARALRALYEDTKRMQKAGLAKALEWRYYQTCAELVKELAEVQIQETTND